MDAKKFSEILSLAMARITREDGSIIDPATLPEGGDAIAVENLWIAWALINTAGAGPFEDQKARIEAWATEREERFGNVRATLQTLGIGAHVGPLEAQVAELGAQRNRLRQLADVGAKEIQRLTMQRDAARQGIAVLLEAYQAGDLAIEHAGIVRVSERGHHHTTACPADDTCQCDGRVVLLKAQLAAAVGEDTPRTAGILEQLMRIPGAVNVAHIDVHADDPDRWAFGLMKEFERAKTTPASGLQGFDPADIVVGAGGQTLEDVATAQPRAPMVTEVCEHCTVTPEGLARLGGRLCFHGRLWRVMPDPDAADHDHVFIDGRCACGESVQ